MWGKLRNIRWPVFTSIPLAVALGLLLLNDFVWKAAYGNWLTGKLSDLAGVVLLALVVFAVAPGRIRAGAALVAMAFAIWKSPLSQPFIDAVNAVSPRPVGRVVDYTDLAALALLPLAAACFRRAEALQLPLPARRAWARPLLAVSAFAMVATVMNIPPYDFEMSVRASDPVAMPSEEDIEQIVKDVLSTRGYTLSPEWERAVRVGEITDLEEFPALYINEDERCSAQYAIEPVGDTFRIDVKVYGGSMKRPKPQGKAILRDLWRKLQDNEFPGVRVVVLER